MKPPEPPLAPAPKSPPSTSWVERAISQGFVQGPDQSWQYFPHGLHRPGVWVSLDLRLALLRLFKRDLYCSLASLVVLFFSPPLALAGGLLLMLVHLRFLKRHLSPCPPCPPLLDQAPPQRGLAEYPREKIWWMLYASLLLLDLNVVMLAQGSEREGIFWIGVVFFGGLAVFLSACLWIKTRPSS